MRVAAGTRIQFNTNNTSITQLPATSRATHSHSVPPRVSPNNQAALFQIAGESCATGALAARTVEPLLLMQSFFRSLRKSLVRLFAQSLCFCFSHSHHRTLTARFNTPFNNQENSNNHSHPSFLDLRLRHRNFKVHVGVGYYSRLSRVLLRTIATCAP